MASHYIQLTHTLPLTLDPQLNKTPTKALLNILIDMTDRIQMIEQQQNEDY